MICLMVAHGGMALGNMMGLVDLWGRAELVDYNVQ